MSEPLPLFEKLREWRSFAPGLDRVTNGLRKIGNPHRGYRHIVVGGTNGKGTVSATLARALDGPVGLFLSPHVFDIRERISIDGNAVPDSAWQGAHHVIRKAHGLEANDPDPDYSFFEWLLLLAVTIFAERGVCRAVFEVGLGGRLDAVNALSPELSVLTNVGLDHMDILGPDIPTIALEKIETARRDRPFILPDSIYALPGVRARLNEIGSRNIPVALRPGLDGNADIVNKSCELLGVKTPARMARLPGRQVFIDRGEGIYIDGAHNEPAWRAMVDWISAQHRECNVLAFLTKGRRTASFCEIVGPLGTIHVWRAGFDREILLSEWPDHVVRLEELGPELYRDRPLLICGSFYGLAPALRELLPNYYETNKLKIIQ